RPFRPQTDPGLLVHHRAPGLDAELFRPGRAGTQESASDPGPVLPAGTGLAAVAADLPGNARHHHCLPSGDLRRLLARLAGDAPRHLAAPADPPHLGRAARPDLRAAPELAADD